MAHCILYINSAEAHQVTAHERELIELFQTIPIVRTFGMSLAYDEAGHSRLSLPYNPALDHGLGGVHGGVMATLLDTAAWFASAARHPGIWVATIDLTIHLLEPAVHCNLQAEGWLVRQGKRIDVAEARVYDASDTLYAIGRATITVTGAAFGQVGEH